MSQLSEVFEKVTPFIEGTPGPSQADDVIDVINPSTGLRCALVAAGHERDADSAVTSARVAFEDGRWRDRAPSGKKKTLERFAELIAAAASELDRLDAEEMGKPVSEPRFNAIAAADLLSFYAEAADKVTGDVFSSDALSLVVQRRVPRGVVAAITPWNFPTYNAALKFAPALAAGNSIVLKPSELSSRSALRLARMAIEAGLPPGVLNVVPGRGDTVGKALAAHPDVNMVTFTGSTDVGRRMLQYAGQSNMKVVATECGGKSPHIVFADGVDIDQAADTIAAAMLTNQGQICSVGSRVLVEQTIEARVIERITQRMRGVVMGNALDTHTTFGPVASARQCERVMDYIEKAPGDGAQLIAGGRRALLESGGCFVEPTLFRSGSPDARIAQQEIFGPVLTLIPFAQEQDALRIANGTIYGLMAYVWTADLSRAMRMVKGLHSSVLVNATAPRGEGPGHAASFEPFGQSGIGTEGGLAGMESYMRRQLVWINHA